MRPIKFRAWDKATKKHWDPAPLAEMVYFSIFTVLEFIGSTYNEEGNLFKRRFELMQYTGLKDKNHVEIYEGDIIWDAHAEIHGKVTFDEGMFCVEWETHIEHLSEVVSDYYTEVMGNIYEHPHLIKEV